MGAVVPTAALPLIAQNIIIGLNALRGTLTLIKISQIQLFEYSAELARETGQGPFHTVYTLDGKSVSSEKANEVLGKENLTCVKRCCCSLTGWFPSGVFTTATWAIAGTAVRHEFIILHTENYVVLIEIGLDGKKNPKTSIQILHATSNKEKKQAEKELLQKKWWTRTMKELKGIDLGLLRFQQIISLISFWILLSRAGGCNYTVIQKNCKSLARSILYFSKKSIDYWDVLYSFWGIFTDKPLYIFCHLEVIIIEKILTNTCYSFSKSMKELVRETIELLEKMRIYQFVEKDTEALIEKNISMMQTQIEDSTILSVIENP